MASTSIGESMEIVREFREFVELCVESKSLIAMILMLGLVFYVIS
jgi:hypothetical protein